MPKPLSYKEVVCRLKDYDGRTRIKQQSGKFDAVNESHISAEEEDGYIDRLNLEDYH